MKRLRSSVARSRFRSSSSPPSAMRRSLSMIASANRENGRQPLLAVDDEELAGAVGLHDQCPHVVTAVGLAAQLDDVVPEVFPLLLRPGVAPLVRGNAIRLAVADQLQVAGRSGIEDVGPAHESRRPPAPSSQRLQRSPLSQLLFLRLRNEFRRREQRAARRPELDALRVLLVVGRIRGHPQSLSHPGRQQAVLAVAERLSVGAGRHQVARCNYPVEILHGDRRRCSGRHRDIRVHRRVDVETARAHLADLALDGFDHVGAAVGVRRGHLLSHGSASALAPASSTREDRAGDGARKLSQDHQPSGTLAFNQVVLDLYLRLASQNDNVSNETEFRILFPRLIREDRGEASEFADL